MPLHGFSVCPVLWDKGGKDWIDTKEEQIDKCTIGESILRRDLWKERDRPASTASQEESDLAEKADLVEEEGKRIGQEGNGTGDGQGGNGTGDGQEGNGTGDEQEGNETGDGQEGNRNRDGQEGRGNRDGQEGNENRIGQGGIGKRTRQEEEGNRTGQEERGKSPWLERTDSGAGQHGDYIAHSAGLSSADTSYSGKEETILRKEISFTSDYGHDLLCYRLFYVPAASNFGAETVGLRVAEDSRRVARCGRRPDSGLMDQIESGYGIEISHFRMKQEGFCLMKGFERLEGISEDLEICLTFFHQLMEGRVYPCSLADLCEDCSELF